MKGFQQRIKSAEIFLQDAGFLSLVRKDLKPHGIARPVEVNHLGSQSSTSTARQKGNPLCERGFAAQK